MVGVALERPVVRRLLRLIELRNTHPAFEGEFAASSSEEHLLSLDWRNGQAGCSLTVDVRRMVSTVEQTTASGGRAAWTA